MDLNLIPFDGWHADDGTKPNPIPLGTTRIDRQASPAKKYIWGQVALSLINSAFAANEVVCASALSASALTLTNDVSTSLSGATNPIGACRAVNACPTSTASITYYTWFQIGGPATIKTNGDNDMVVGDGFVAATGTDGAANGIAQAATSADGPILRTFAIALASEAASACLVNLRCPDYAGY